MALPPLDHKGASRPASPERGAQSPAGSTPALTQRSAVVNLVPLRGSLTAEPSAASIAAPLRGAPSTAGGSPLRSGAANGPASPGVRPKVVCGPRKLTQAQLTEKLHGQLLEVLRTEWRRIKSSNLGVLSGTAVVEELLLRRIQTAAAELHMLAITHAPAAERLAELCRAMSPAELQQLQVMFDVTGHSELSDYVRLSVFNTSDPAAKEVVGDLRALRQAAGASRRARSTPSSRRRAGAGAAPPRRPDFNSADPSAFRFATLLPDGHRLVSRARDVAAKRQQEEEERRRAAEAREARDRERARADAEAAAGALPAAGGDGRGEAERLADASARSAVLHGRANPPPDILPYYAADVEEQWRRTIGTRVPGEGVYGTVIMLSEPLPPYEAPPDVARMRAEAEEAAAFAAARAQGTLTRANTLASSLSMRVAPPTPSGGGRGNGIAIPWSGPGGSASPVPFMRLATARHGGGGGGGGGGAAAGGGGPGAAGPLSAPPAPPAGVGTAEGQGSGTIRFGGTSRLGPRPTLSLSVPGGEGAQERAGGAEAQGSRGPSRGQGTPPASNEAGL